MAANLNVLKTSTKDYILSKSHFSFTGVHCVIYKQEISITGYLALTQQRKRRRKQAHVFRQREMS